MTEKEQKYAGIIPAFYACYEDDGTVSVERTKALTRYFLEKGVKGVYVGGSSGECIYQSVAERKTVLEAVVEAAEGKLTIIAHVACNNTQDSQELAAHAESLGVDAIAAIPPIYFKLPDAAVAKYWNDISSAAPNTDFIIYNIPVLAGVALSTGLLRDMMKNPRVIGVKNSSGATQDIQMWHDEGAIVFNGPDEQLISGLTMGAIGGIGGTYAAMPELFIEAMAQLQAGNIATAFAIQNDICRIIYAFFEAKSNMYATIKGILREGGLELGGVRAPLLNLSEGDMATVKKCKAMIDEAIAKHCN
ncbi:dihydrodipicolinate synthase family protein [Bengtsoniella intestinalis]|uniref:dihydrodipicolinate synthase family protein n=1 Tax=Bengtsoniella intestinalis TaxID=3073143 RepID=UPI00391F6FE0